MFTPDYIIENVQTAQKKVVETLVLNDSTKKELVKLIDAQSKFAKTQYSASIEIAQAIWKNASEAFYTKKAA
jgi:hypothetical protein